MDRIVDRTDMSGNSGSIDKKFKITAVIYACWLVVLITLVVLRRLGW